MAGEEAVARAFLFSFSFDSACIHCIPSSLSADDNPARCVPPHASPSFKKVKLPIYVHKKIFKSQMSEIQTTDFKLFHMTGGRRVLSFPDTYTVL